MAVAEQSYPFQMPAQSAPVNVGDRYQPKIVQAWVNDLPLANTGESARALYRFLLELNESQMPVSDRFKNLEALLVPARVLLDVLNQRLLQANLPLDEVHDAIARLVEQLQIHLMVGYKIVSRQLQDESITTSLLHGGMRLDALSRLFFLLGRIQLDCYRLYRPLPALFWREAHGFYHYAVAHRLHQKTSASVIKNGRTKYSLEDQYIRCLLLELASPYQLKAGEVAQVYKATQNWTRYCDIRACCEHAGTGNYFVINKASDAPPVPGERVDDLGQTHGWMLDLGRLGNKLIKKLATSRRQQNEDIPRAFTETNADNGELSSDLVFRLIQTWGMESERHDTRWPAEGDVHVAVGLQAIYLLLGGEDIAKMHPHEYWGRPHDFMTRQEQQKAAIEMLQDDESEVLKLVEPRSIEEVEIEEPKPQDWREHEAEPHQLDVEPCRIVDESSGGYHLRWLGGCETGPKVGELIAMIDDDGDVGNGNWVIGVIRWIRSFTTGNLRFGVEKIGLNIQPVVLHRRHTVNHETKHDYYRALLLQDGLEQARALISDVFFSDKLDVTSLIEHGSEQQIKLTSMVESSASFSWYEFETMGQPGMHTPGRDQMPSDHTIDLPGEPAKGSSEAYDQEDDSEFEQLWRDLLLETDPPACHSS
ncbi:MAG: hypothetical protein KZQ58_09300 [gamma proteobacterium symbiont of Bathyaustriella thionipta]|nr:hypothetical protein [gamma proteobacterium symbiont of Bathyaustriella thionipta]